MSIILTMTREKWLKQIKNQSNSWNSENSATSAINRWDQFLDGINQDDGKAIRQIKKWDNSTKVYQFLNDYVLWLSGQVSPKTVKLFFGFLKSWIRSNGIRIYDEDIKQFVKFPKQLRETRKPLTPEIIKNLIFNAPKIVKCILFVALSSGMRINEILQLRVMDINCMVDPIKIRIRAETVKIRQERVAYISAEAWEHIKPLLKDKEPIDLLFFRNPPKFLLQNFETRFHRVRKKCGYLTKYSNGINYHVNVHAFRANFITQATQILSGDIAHALAGHSAYLAVYFRLSPEKQADMYHKLEPYLTVSDEARQRVIILEKDQQLNEMSLMKKEIIELKAFKKREEDRNSNHLKPF